MDEVINQLLLELKKITHKKIELEKRPKDYGTGLFLHHSELYLIETLGKNEGLSMTRVAGIMGITKGAVSQTFKRLDKKGLVEKFADPVNASRSLLYLNKLGRKVLTAHENWHKEKDRDFVNYLEKLDSDEIFTIKDFLSRYNFLLEDRLK